MSETFKARILITETRAIVPLCRSFRLQHHNKYHQSILLTTIPPPLDRKHNAEDLQLGSWLNRCLDGRTDHNARSDLLTPGERYSFYDGSLSPTDSPMDIQFSSEHRNGFPRLLHSPTDH